MQATPVSLAALLGEFGPCFSAWTFPVFCALACGLLAQAGRRSVCGMLVGAGLGTTWSHHRAHRFFSHAAWSPDAVSAVLARLVVRALVPDGQALSVAVDDTLFRRRGKKVHAAGWFHDGAAQGQAKLGYGNNWVIAAIVVRPGFMQRPLALPVAAALVRKGTEEASRVDAARRLVEALGAALGGRAIDVVADSAYASKALRDLPAGVTWTTRLRSNAALYDLAPPRTGRRGRPRSRGDKLAGLGVLSGQLHFSPVQVTRYGTTASVSAAAVTCLWHGVFGSQPVTVVCVRERAKTGYDIALVSTDVDATRAQLIERYASRWSIEVAIEDAKQTVGVGQARNRVQAAVERTVPFGLTIGTLAVVWYALCGHDPDDVAIARQAAPWYRTKAHASVLDMVAKLRRVVIAAQFRRDDPTPPTTQEINLLRLAWAHAGA